jgi:hypothetical protein
MERQINRRRQGDLGEASAIEWLTSLSATVLIPFGHSPDFDLFAESNGRLLRIQVKTSTQSRLRVDGHNRSAVTLATSGGNQSWTGVREPLDRRDSTISSCTRAMAVGGSSLLTVIEAQTAITLGGPRYSEFEIEPGRPIHELVYAVDPALESDSRSGEYPSGQRTATVNRQAQPSQVRILPPPFRPRPGFRPSKYDRKLGRGGEAVVNQKRRVTIPRQA